MFASFDVRSASKYLQDEYERTDASTVDSAIYIKFDQREHNENGRIAAKCEDSAIVKPDA